MRSAAHHPRSTVALLGSLLVTTLGCGLIALIPWFLGVSWSAVGANLAAVPPTVLLGLVALWLGGLLAHAPVLRAAMPGLTTRQALTLNLSGSAVSNVLPVGGPAGMGLGYAMARGWGFTADAFTSYTVSTNLWNAVGKFVAATGVLATAALLGVGLPTGLGPVVLSAAAFLALATGTAFAAFRSRRATAAAGRRLDRLLRAVRPSTRPGAATSWLLASRDRMAIVVRRGWAVMATGVLVYLVLQAVLLLACLAAVGAGAPLVAVAVAFAIERLISLAPITPGAAGLAELGTVTALTSFGVAPVAAAAGVLLYRILIFAIEIPVGGALALGWMHHSRRGRLSDPVDLTPAHPTEVAA